MAIYQPSALVSCIRGKLGPLIYQRFKNLLVVKSAEISVLDPHSIKQEAIRSAIGSASSSWFGTLTQQQRNNWETFALRFKNPPSPPAGIRCLITDLKKPSSGLNAFQRINALIASVGGVQLDDAPLDKPCLLPLEGFTVAWNGGTLAFDISWTVPSDSDGNTFVRVWIDSVQESFHKQIALIQPDDLNSVACAGIFGALGAWIDFSALAGEYILIQADRVHFVYGTKSMPTDTKQLLIG